MNIQLKFLDSKPSDDIKEYAEERFRKLQKHETKPVKVQLSLFVERHNFIVKAHIRGPQMELRATAHGDNFYDAIDQVLHRCVRQVSRKKARIQNHKCYERTREEWLDRLDEGLTPHVKGYKQAA